MAYARICAGTYAGIDAGTYINIYNSDAQKNPGLYGNILYTSYKICWGLFYNVFFQITKRDFI